MARWLYEKEIGRRDWFELGDVEAGDWIFRAMELFRSMYPEAARSPGIFRMPLQGLL